MDATSSAANWFFEIGSEVHGPVTFSELQQKAAAGELLPHTPIRDGRTGSWVFAETVQGVFQRIDSLPTAATRIVEDAHVSHAPTIPVEEPRVEPTLPASQTEIGGNSSKPGENPGDNRDRARKSIPYGLIVAWGWIILNGYFLLVIYHVHRQGPPSLDPRFWLLVFAGLLFPVAVFVVPLLTVIASDWRRLRSGDWGTGILPAVVGIVVVLVGKCCLPPEPLDLSWPPTGASLPSETREPAVPISPAAEAVERGIKRSKNTTGTTRLRIAQRPSGLIQSLQWPTTPGAVPTGFRET